MLCFQVAWFGNFQTSTGCGSRNICSRKKMRLVWSLYWNLPAQNPYCCESRCNPHSVWPGLQFWTRLLLGTKRINETSWFPCQVGLILPCCPFRHDRYRRATGLSTAFMEGEEESRNLSRQKTRNLDKPTRCPQRSSELIHTRRPDSGSPEWKSEPHTIHTKPE